MKNIVLQHYSGELGELEELSKANISAYAESIGAEYRLLRGDVFHPDLSPPCQKLAMFNEEFDSYDVVCMVDIDMFTNRNLNESIFDVQGLGVSTQFQRRLKWAYFRKAKGMVKLFSIYWGGAIWRLEKQQRKALRAMLPKIDLNKYNGILEDEGIMHQLAFHAGIKGKQTILPGGEKWAYGSYLEGVEQAALIHVRPRTSRKGPRVPKIDVYHSLVKQGLI